MKLILIVATLLLSYNAYPQTINGESSQHKILNTLERWSPNITTSGISSNKFQSLVNEKLKDANTREQFINEAFEMELNLQKALLMDYKNKSIHGESYRFRRMVVGSTEDSELSINHSGDSIIESLKLLYFAITSTRFMSDTEFSQFSIKLVNHLKQLHEVIRETNKYKNPGKGPKLEIALTQYYTNNLPLDQDIQVKVTKESNLELYQKQMRESITLVQRELQILNVLLREGLLSEVAQIQLSSDWNYLFESLRNTEIESRAEIMSDPKVIEEYDLLLSKLKRDIPLSGLASELKLGSSCSRLFK